MKQCHFLLKSTCNLIIWIIEDIFAWFVLLPDWSMIDHDCGIWGIMMSIFAMKNYWRNKNCLLHDNICCFSHFVAPGHGLHLTIHYFVNLVHIDENEKSKSNAAMKWLIVDTYTTGALCMIFMILVSLENVKNYSHMVARFISKTKINVVWNFFSHR